jgi:transposase
MRPHGSPKELEERRRRAVELLRSGMRPAEVAERVGVDRVSVYRWQATRKELGVRGLRARAAPGRPPKLSEEDRRSLEVILIEGAMAAGYDTDLWTCPRVAQVIRERFSIDYHPDHIGRLLHRMGWSPQKPVRRAMERDEMAIRTWIKKEWPRVKKTPPAGGRSSRS